MTSQRTRFVEFERGEIDMETGEFPMVLATDGEASDGDILSIEGAQFTSRAPLQISHVNDPRDTLGTVSGFRRDLQSTPKRLRARGQIELQGEGPTADIRRDIAHMIRSGHVTGVSVRWEPLKFTRRASLPKEHYAHVKEDDPDYRKRGGFFHERWRVLEGSVVAIQADKAAMIGRAEETAGIVSDFWRAMAEDAKDREEIEARSEAIEARMNELTLVPSSAGGATESESSSGSTPVEAPAEDPSRADHEKLLKLLGSVLETNSSLQDRIAALEQSRVDVAPAPTFRTVQDIFDQFRTKMGSYADKTVVEIQAMIDAKRGKVTPTQTYRQKMQAEIEQIMRQALAEEHAATTDAKVDALSAKLDGLIAAWREKQPAPEVQADE